jgi:tetratricopeptide (TPR) repeat protein
MFSLVRRDEELPKREIPQSRALKPYKPADYYYRRGLLALYTKNYPKAIALLKDAVHIDPDFPMGHYYLGVAHFLSGDRISAIAEYHRAVELDPTNYAASFNLAMLYHIEGRYDEAIRFYRQAIRISPDSDEAYLKLGLAYASKGMNDKAVEAYKEAIKIKILRKLGEI